MMQPEAVDTRRSILNAAGVLSASLVGGAMLTGARTDDPGDPNTADLRLRQVHRTIGRVPGDHRPRCDPSDIEIYDAKIDSARVLAITGSTSHDLGGTHFMQAVDITALLQGVALYNVAKSRRCPPTKKCRSPAMTRPPSSPN